MSHYQLDELRAERDRKLEEANAIINRAEGDLEGDDLARFDEITAEVERLNDRYEKMETLIRVAQRPSSHEPGGSESGPQFMQRVDPWEAPQPTDSAQQRADRARAAIEHVRGEYVADADREHMERVVRDPDDAEYVTAASDPNYRAAFAKWLRNPQAGHLSFTPEEQHAFARVQMSRTAMAETNASAMLPVSLDPSIILTGSGALGSFRKFSRVENIGTSAWHGVTSSGVSASFDAEAAEVSDDSPSVSAATVTPQAARAYVQASYELVQDSNIADQLAVVLGDAKRYLEESKYATGAGTGSNEPEGLFTTVSATTASRVSATTNSQFGAVDLFAVGQALPARWQENAVWVSNYGWEYTIRNFANSPSPYSSTFWADLAQPAPPMLLGKPYWRTSGGQAPPLSVSTASNDDIIVLLDARQFVIADRIGMSIASSNWVLGSSRRPTAEWGFLGFWRTGSKLIVPDAARLLRV